jgi:NarL family two-component system sensor histidine kinase LiaS
MKEKKSGSYGLENIRERIAGIGGNVKIISFPEKGTSVEISIPIVTGGQK